MKTTAQTTSNTLQAQAASSLTRYDVIKDEANFYWNHSAMAWEEEEHDFANYEKNNLLNDLFTRPAKNIDDVKQIYDKLREFEKRRALQEKEWKACEQQKAAQAAQNAKAAYSAAHAAIRASTPLATDKKPSSQRKRCKDFCVIL